jgi:hypothetical protein
MTLIVSAVEDGYKARQLSIVHVICDANDVRVLGSEDTHRDPVATEALYHDYMRLPRRKWSFEKAVPVKWWRKFSARCDPSKVTDIL